MERNVSPSFGILSELPKETFCAQLSTHTTELAA